jgi:glycerol-3-phosphate dehydrogenase
VTSALSSDARSAAIARMSGTAEFDVLVVGGGIVGAGTALDAVTRGLSTAIVEAGDWASGTSSRSSKLIHGGLRYLEMMDFGLVREALRERSLLLQHIAPHLVRPVPFLYPLRHRFWERPYVGAGMTLYDSMAVSAGNVRGLPRHRHLTRRGVLRIAPALKPTALVGGVQYWDAQVDDARYVVTLVRTAVSYGALAVNYARVIGFDRQGDWVTGARLVDAVTGREFSVRARQVISAAGVWSNDTQSLAGTRGEVRIRAAKGVHVLVPRDRLRSSSGIILRTEQSVLFVIPWGRHWIIGTTDTAWSLSDPDPAASSADIDYLLDHVNAVLATPLRRGDVEGVYAGLRPLLSGESDLTSKLSRQHVVSHPRPGLVVVAGGKYTTYRVMAADAVDEAARGLGSRIPRSCTDRTPLLGADGYQALWNQRRSLAVSSGLHVARIEHLLHRYGSLAAELLTLVAGDRSLGEPIPGAADYLRVEVVYAATHEDARHVADVLKRRTRISIECRDGGAEAAPLVAALMAGPLAWDGQRQAEEVELYLTRVHAERAAQDQPDDVAAAAQLASSVRRLTLAGRQM